MILCRSAAGSGATGSVWRFSECPSSSPETHAAFPFLLSQQEGPGDGRRPRPAARRDAEMAADRAGHRAGNDKIVLAAEHIGSKRAAHDLEQPFHTMPIRRSGKLAPHPLGEGAEVIFDIFPGQRLGPGAQRHLARKRHTSETNQLLVFDKDAVQRDSPARRQARRRVDRSAGFRGGVERNDDVLDSLCHERLGVMRGPGQWPRSAPARRLWRRRRRAARQCGG